MASSCWYCGTQLRRYTGAKADRCPDQRTVEHLKALANGGSCDRENIRHACRRCNGFVGDWDVEIKIRFRRLIRSLKGWPGLRKTYPVKRGRRHRVQLALLRMERPKDPASRKARKAAEVGPVVTAGAYLAETGHMPRGRDRDPWTFRLDGETWEAAAGFTYSQARRSALRQAKKRGSDKVEVMA